MARRAIPSGEQARLAFEAFCGPPSSRKKPKASASTKGKKALERAMAEVEDMVKANSFLTAEERHIVGLHAVLHRSVLGVEDLELAGASFLGACSAVRKLAKEHFDDQVIPVVEYVRWAWSREKAREAKRIAENNHQAGRLGWKLLFVVRSMITDYRVAQHRRTRTS